MAGTPGHLICPGMPGIVGMGGRILSAPSTLGFDFANYNLSVRQSGNAYYGVIDLAALMPASVFSGTQYYVDIATGSDSNDGLSWGSSFKSIHKAFTAGNLTGNPYRAKIKAGIYERANSFSGTTSIAPTQACYFESDGGRVVSSIFDSLTWSLDGTQTNCYTAIRSNVTRVFDRLNTDSYGNYVELTKVADAATCNSTPGSWAQVTTTVYVHRTDETAVTNSNTRVLISSGGFNCGLVSVYIKGIDFEGGNSGAVAAVSTATRNLVFEDCTAKFAGGASNICCGFQVTNTTGLAIFKNCTADANTQDGFNGHWLLGGAVGLSLVTINCVGRDNGRFTSTSNNGLTWHDGVIGIDINGLYDGNYGGNVHIINASKGWLVGTNSKNSHGDASLGGTIPSSSFVAANTATLWPQGAKASGSDDALYLLDTSFIYRRRTMMSGAEVAAAGATIGDF